MRSASKANLDYGAETAMKEAVGVEDVDDGHGVNRGRRIMPLRG